MLKHKRPRDKGKFSFTRYFQKFSEGDSVAVVRELSVNAGFPRRMQGRTGRIIKKQGAAYEVEINDYNKKKKFLIRPIHLKKIQEDPVK